MSRSHEYNYCSRMFLLMILVVIDGAFSSTIHSHANIGEYHGKKSIESLVESFRSDFREIQSLPPSSLTTPCVLSARDATSTYPWTLQNWNACCTHSLSRYIHHFRKLPDSTTARYILPTVAATFVWSLLISILSHYTPILPKRIDISASKFSVTLVFFQAPLLLLLALRANRALDRLLEARRAWAALSRSARTLMGIISCYILPTRPEVALIMGRYLGILGWALKGVLRDESDVDLIRTVLGRSYKPELDWIANRRAQGDKCPTVLICRLRKLISTAANNGTAGEKRIDAIPPVLIYRMEEILHQIEIAVGTCNRILMSPTPPVYTAHTSRILVVYLGILPLALVSMGASTTTIMCASVFASYVLVGIDEIGCFLEHPFPIIPMETMAKMVQNEVERQVDMIGSMPRTMESY